MNACPPNLDGVRLASPDAFDPRTVPVRQSNLKKMAQSPATFLHALLNKFQPSGPMRLGTLVHHGVLGCEYDEDDNPIVFYEGERRGNAWAAFKAANENAEIFTSGEVDKAQPIIKAVLASELARPYLIGEPERHIGWKIGDRECSSRLDVLGAGFLSDLKTTSSARPDDFKRQAVKMLYHAQAAFYVDACHAIGRTDVTAAYLIAVETKPPYLVVPYRLTDALLEEGRRCYRGWFETLLGCEASGEWPGYAQAVVDLDLPTWMRPPSADDDDDLDEDEDDEAAA